MNSIVKKICVVLIIAAVLCTTISVVAFAVDQQHILDVEGYVGPNPAATPTPTPTSTPTSTAAPTSTPTVSTTPTSAPTPTALPSSSVASTDDVTPTPTPTKGQIFKKMPLNKVIQPGDTIDYEISGFGNDKDGFMERFTIVDLLPAGLELEEIKLPAFTKGSGLTYTLVYETSTSGRKVFKSNVSAGSAFHAKLPVMSSGEHMEYFSIIFDKVPSGFGMGDKIIFVCRLDKNPPDEDIVNQAALSYRYAGKEYSISATTRKLEINGVGPKTNDTQNMMFYSLLVVTSGIVIAVMILLRKRQAYSTDKSNK